MTHAAGALYGDEAKVRICSYCQLPVPIFNWAEVKRTKSYKKVKAVILDTDKLLSEDSRQKVFIVLRQWPSIMHR